MPVLYDNKKLIPSPFLQISKDFQKSEDGTIIGSLFSLTLTGKLVSSRGSPRSGITTVQGGSWTDDFYVGSGYPPIDDEDLTHDQHLRAILRKQEAMRNLFKKGKEGKAFEVQSADGSAPLKCYPRIKAITFQSDLWYDICEYTIEMEADVLYINGTTSEEDDYSSIYISEASEDWSMEFGDQPDIYRLTHTISAKGKRFYDSTGLVKEAWEQAKTWVQARLGIDSNRVIATGVLNLSGFTGYNHARGENVNELTGNYSVTESWIVSSEHAIEDYNINSRVTAEDGRTSVTVEGSVTGFDTRNSSFAVTESKWTAALDKFNTVESNFFTRAQSYSGVTLNPTVYNKAVGRNIPNGVINYSYEYNNRPANSIAGALSEVITVTDDNPSDLIAIITVLGRTSGPVIQNLDTKSESRRSINIEAVMPVAYGSSTSQPDTDSIVNGNAPAGTVYKQQDQESWSASNGRYSRTVSWVY